MRRVRPGPVLLWLAVLCVVSFVALPIVVTVVVAFSSLPYLAFPPVGFSTRWFVRAIENREFWDGLWLSLRLAALAAVAATILGSAAALGLACGALPGRGLMQAFLLSPLVFPLLVTGIAFLQFFNLMGMRAVFWQLAIAHTAITLPYVVRTVGASLQMLDPRLEEAAAALGATRLEIILKVTLPLASSGVVAGFIFAFVTSFDNFPVSMWLVNAEYRTLPLTVFSLIERFLDPTIAAISSLTIAMSVVTALLVDRLVGLKRFASV